MKKYIPPQVDSETLAELQKFAKAEGRTWKEKLNDHWMRASAPGGLHRLRNTHGPEWLASYKLPAEETACPNPAQYRRVLAKKLESLAKDLSYIPSTQGNYSETVEVDMHEFHKLSRYAEMVADYQAAYEAMPRLTDTMMRNDCEKKLSDLNKLLQNGIR